MFRLDHFLLQDPGPRTTVNLPCLLWYRMASQPFLAFQDFGSLEVFWLGSLDLSLSGRRHRPLPTSTGGPACTMGRGQDSLAKERTLWGFLASLLLVHRASHILRNPQDPPELQVTLQDTTVSPNKLFIYFSYTDPWIVSSLGYNPFILLLNTASFLPLTGSYVLCCLLPS